MTKSWADQHTTYTEAIRIVRSLIKSRAGKKSGFLFSPTMKNIIDGGEN